MHDKPAYQTASRTIHRWGIVGFVFAALYGGLAAIIGSAGRSSDQIMVAALVVVALCSFLGSLAAFSGNTRATRALWLIGGIIGFPLGMVLITGSRHVRDAGDALTSPQFA